MSRNGAIVSNVGSICSYPLMQHLNISRWVVSVYAWYALLLCRTLTSLTLLQHEHSCCQSLLLKHHFAYDTKRLNICCSVDCLVMDKENSQLAFWSGRSHR